MRKRYKKDALPLRSGFDRRIIQERREALSLNYIEDENEERRGGDERRQSGENRQDWIRYNKWSSVYVGK